MANKKAYTGKDVKNALAKKGFEVENGDHIYLRLHVDGKKTAICTRVSHGRKDYSGLLWQALRKQLHLNDHQLRQLIDCPLTHGKYVEILTERNVLKS